MKNKTEIMKSVSGIANKTVMKLKKHSPEILIVAGIAGTVVSAVIACKATCAWVPPLLQAGALWRRIWRRWPSSSAWLLRISTPRRPISAARWRS